MVCQPLPERRAGAFWVQPDERIIGSLHTGYPGKIPAGQARVSASERLTVMA
ncbi:hypothetical protein HZF08_13675 [Paenibacillus sp. CGMCC 1.16610]|uniref:Uncharacterized protein n=1 Tax=Paenibacillus anseongense TaxID=2682845 RepID=A0ABW9U7J7_9BACL|nr:MULTISPECIES: hypothetical protein [Paenibacillus]MBA2939360.1 hypothetical protein [Paenibacillus sp. CGMCC 1.16610]MVQ35318.1 hypothetical protein [Paenibacillus anseongense]